MSWRTENVGQVWTVLNWNMYLIGPWKGTVVLSHLFISGCFLTLLYLLLMMVWKLKPKVWNKKCLFFQVTLHLLITVPFVQLHCRLRARRFWLEPADWLGPFCVEFLCSPLHGNKVKVWVPRPEYTRGLTLAKIFSINLSSLNIYSSPHTCGGITLLIVIFSVLSDTFPGTTDNTQMTTICDSFTCFLFSLFNRHCPWQVHK